MAGRSPYDSRIHLTRDDMRRVMLARTNLSPDDVDRFCDLWEAGERKTMHLADSFGVTRETVISWKKTLLEHTENPDSKRPTHKIVAEARKAGRDALTRERAWELIDDLISRHDDDPDVVRQLLMVRMQMTPGWKAPDVSATINVEAQLGPRGLSGIEDALQERLQLLAASDGVPSSFLHNLRSALQAPTEMEDIDEPKQLGSADSPGADRTAGQDVSLGGQGAGRSVGDVHSGDLLDAQAGEDPAAGG